MKFTAYAGATERLARIFVQDSTDNSALTGLLYSATGLKWYWMADGDSDETEVTLATMTVGTWANGGFKEVDATNLPGVYEIGIPDAALADIGVASMLLFGATNMAAVTIEIEVRDPREAYADGCIYLDGSASNTNEVLGIDGTAVNPVSTSEAAEALAKAAGFNKVKLLPGESVTLNGLLTDLHVVGGGLTSVVMNGNEVQDTLFSDCYIQGPGAGVSGCDFLRCHLQNVDMPYSVARQCELQGDFNLLSPGNVRFVDCSARFPTVGITVDFDGYTNGACYFYRWGGGNIEIQNLGDSASQFVYITGDGALTLNANCTGGTVYYSSGIQVTNNGTGITLTPVNTQAADAAGIAAAVVAQDVTGQAANTVGNILETTNARLPGSGTLATQGDVTTITQAQRIQISLPEPLLIQDSGDNVVRVYINAYNEQNTAENLDSVPVVAVVNPAGDDRSGNLGTVTKVAATTGRYYVDYTVADSHAVEQLLFQVDATEDGTTTQYPRTTHTLPEAQASNPLTPSDVAGMRHRLNLDGTRTPPTEVPGAPDGNVVTIEDVDATDQLEASLNPDPGRANSVTITIVNAPASPVEGAALRVIKDGETDVSLTTDVDGEAPTTLNNGTHTINATAPGHTPTIFTLEVDGATTDEFTLPLIVSPTLTGPEISTGVAFIHDESGTGEDGIQITAYLVKGSGENGYVRDEKVKPGTSAGGGNVSIDGFQRGCVYKFQAGDGPLTDDFEIPNTPTFSMPEMQRLDDES